MSSAATSLIRSLFTTCTAIGTSCSACSRRCAVTTTSSRMEALLASCASAVCGTRADRLPPARTAATARARTLFRSFIMNPVIK